MPAIRLDPHSRPLLAFLLTAGLALKALVPAGWMPVLDAQGARLALCGSWRSATPMQPTTMATSHHKGGHGTDRTGHDGPSGKHEGSGDPPCAFAAAALPWLGAATAQAPADDVPTPDRPGFPATVAIGHGLAAPPPPSTGPPILS